MLFSTLSLVLYVSFLISQQLLYATNDFDSVLPWASFEKKLTIVRCLYKFLLSAAFVFDKAGVYRGEIGMACFVFCLFIVQQRFIGTLVFVKSVNYASILYEVLTMWLFLCISIFILDGTLIDVICLLVIVACGVIFAALLILYQEH